MDVEFWTGGGGGGGAPFRRNIVVVDDVTYIEESQPPLLQSTVCLFISKCIHIDEYILPSYWWQVQFNYILFVQHQMSKYIFSVLKRETQQFLQDANTWNWGLSRKGEWKLY